MALLKEKKSGIIKEFGAKSGDTGSPEVQGLLKLVNQRRKLLEYLKKTSATRYQGILDKLALRK